MKRAMLAPLILITMLVSGSFLGGTRFSLAFGKATPANG
jgi:hypothetical protein